MQEEKTYNAVLYQAPLPKWSPPNAPRVDSRDVYTQRPEIGGATPEQDVLACSTAESDDDSSQGLIIDVVTGLLSSQKTTAPWDQRRCSKNKNYEQAPCLSLAYVPSYSKKSLPQIIQRLEFDMAHGYTVEDPQYGATDEDRRYCLKVARQCVESENCLMNEETGVLVENDFFKQFDRFSRGRTGLSEQDLVKGCISNKNTSLTGPRAVTMAGLFLDPYAGEVSLPRVASCARDRAYYFLRSNRAKGALAKRLETFATEQNTTVKKLREDDLLVRIQNDEFAKEMNTWKSARNNAICPQQWIDGKIQRVPIRTAAVRARFDKCIKDADHINIQTYNKTSAADVFGYTPKICLDFSDFNKYMQLEELKKEADSEQTDPQECVFECNSCSAEDYYKKFNITLGISKLERFTKLTYPNEVTDKYEQEFQKKMMGPEGITLQVPMTFYDTNRWLQDKVSPKFLYSWLNLKAPLKYLLSKTSPTGILINALFIASAGSRDKNADGSQDEGFDIVKSWEKATTPPPTPLTIGTAEELVKSHLKKTYSFARKIGMTWIFLQWVRLLGVLVELLALVYLATKVLTRRFANRKGAMCHSVCLFLNRSPEERISKIKSKASEKAMHARDASGRFTGLSDKTRSASDGSTSSNGNRDVYDDRQQTTSLKAYRAKKKKSREKYSIPSRVWASVLISLAMTLLSCAMCLNFWWFLVKASRSGIESLDGMTDGLNNPAGTLTKFLRWSGPKVRDKIYSKIPANPLGDVTMNTDFHSLAEQATSGILDGLTDQGQSVVLNFTYGGVNMPNVTLSVGTVRLLQSGIAECIANCTKGPGIKKMVADYTTEVTDSTMDYLNTAMKTQIQSAKDGTGTSAGLASDLSLLYGKVAGGVQDNIRTKVAEVTDPKTCEAKMRENMGDVEQCFDNVATDTASTLSSPVQSELVARNITYEEYKERAGAALSSKYNQYTTEDLPKAMCQKTKALVTSTVTESWNTMLSADNLMNGTVEYALDSDIVRAGFEQLPGVNGNDMYKYMKSLGQGDREMLMGLGSKYLGDLLGYVNNNKQAEMLRKVMRDCYPNVTIAGDTAQQRAANLYGSKTSAKDLDSAECKKRLYNAVDIRQSSKYKIIRTILDVLAVVGWCGCGYAILCFGLVAYQVSSLFFGRSFLVLFGVIKKIDLCFSVPLFLCSSVLLLAFIFSISHFIVFLLSSFFFLLSSFFFLLSSSFFPDLWFCGSFATSWEQTSQSNLSLLRSCFGLQESIAGRKDDSCRCL